MRKIIILATFALLFLGCAPKYKIVYDYTQPSSVQARECIKQCYLDLKTCEDNCALNYDRCVRKAENIGTQNYNKSLYTYQREHDKWVYKYDLYELEYERYEDRWEDAHDMYEFFSEECKKNKKSSACSKRSFYRSKMSLLHKPIEPIKPRKPELEDEIRKVKNVLCSKDCKCKEVYNSCYTSCGGKVTSKKIYIENCPNK